MSPNPPVTPASLTGVYEVIFGPKPPLGQTKLPVSEPDLPPDSPSQGGNGEGRGNHVIRNWGSAYDG